MTNVAGKPLNKGRLFVRSVDRCFPFIDCGQIGLPSIMLNRHKKDTHEKHAH